MNTLSEERWPLGTYAEADLVSMARAGDDAAFGELLKRNYPSTLRRAYGMLCGDADAEDAVLQAFFKAYSRLQQLEERSKFSAWIAKIVTNECLSLRRRAGWTERISLDQVKHAPRISTNWPEEQASRRQIIRLVRQGIRRIPEIFRRPLILWYLQERPMDDIVQELGVSAAAVKSRLTRGRAELRRTLSRHLPHRLEGF